MRRNAPIYIWRKSTKREWLLKHQATLDAMSGGRLAVIEQVGRKHLVVEACANRAAAERLLRIFGGKVDKLPRDWLTRFFPATTGKSIRIGARLVIMNAGVAVTSRQGSSKVLHIPAGAAFGTGEHATTAMTLRMLERLTRARPASWRLFDAGTGSGILALAGARFGAEKVVAIDNDPTAIATARENARSNRISGVKFVTGDVKRTLRGRFDLITANLYSELLAALLPQFGQSLARDGRLILSGILLEQEPALVRALQANRFRIEETRRRGKWIALVAKHPGKNVVDAKEA